MKNTCSYLSDAYNSEIRMWSGFLLSKASSNKEVSAGVRQESKP